MATGLRAIAKAVESPPAPTGARASSRPYLCGGTSTRCQAGSVRALARKRQTQRGSAKATASRLVSTYPFDRWIQKYHPDVPFERYADDAICHCKSEAQARLLMQELETRLAECKLALHVSGGVKPRINGGARLSELLNNKGACVAPLLLMRDGRQKAASPGSRLWLEGRRSSRIKSWI
ncbi:hypothetical protein D9M68_448210 [compost metagenome]